MPPARPFFARISRWVGLSLVGALTTAAARADPAPVTFRSLLRELTDREAVTRLPEPEYQCLQASSYNRESIRRDLPGWFADSDGTGFIRTVEIGGRQEWLVLEHDGPGCLTKFWTPFFYYDLGDHTGPNVRIYLDGSDVPVVDESLIQWVLGHGSVPIPFAAPTARAGDLYLPIPFAQSCRVTLGAKPFYHLINYRAYAPGTAVETFRRDDLRDAGTELAATGNALQSEPATKDAPTRTRGTTLKPGEEILLRLPAGPSAIHELVVELPDAPTHPASLRSTLMTLEFDGEPAVWCPVGDFFGSADALHPHRTWQRSVDAHGRLVSRWVMPYRRSGDLRLHNLGTAPVRVSCSVTCHRTDWDGRSLHFHATWRPDDVVPGTPFQDWNFVDIRGEGIYVGDQWTVLNPQAHTWWGEGDEKIYVDAAWDRGFPTHFGTGTEDYYGWAGGVLPTRADEFSHPFLANVRVGGVDGGTQGYNICLRTRSLDAIPFHRRLRFDMESSFGTDIRNPWNLLGYSAVTFWYARPGAEHNRPPDPRAAGRGITTLGELARQAEDLRTAPTTAR